MITLIIKGDMPAAALAASAHRVKLHSLTAHPKFRECIGVAPSADLRALVEWFCEPSPTEPPYSDGTLTFYSVASNE